MSLGINTNIPALNAQRYLRAADGQLTKSINRLSSGLRINTASDDPSGLAISQRLKTQFLGLERAVMNSQDAISYLQTAEAALNETQNILQRMRELSIQAANGTLTASDRQQIQREVDQLKQEVTRISTSSEFNTKKLLDGTGSALWSSSSDNVSAVIRGKVREGNYELEIDTEPVENYVMKSDIFRLKTGAIGVENVDLGATHASYTLTGTNTASGTISFDFGTGSIYSIAVPALITEDALVETIQTDDYLNDYIRAYRDAAGDVVVESIVAGEQGNAYTIQASIDNVGFVTDGLKHALTGGEDYPSGVTGVADPANMPASPDNVSAHYTLWVDNVICAAATDALTIVAAYEQPVGGTVTAASTQSALATAVRVGPASGTITAPTGSGYAILEVLEGGIAGTDEIMARVSFDQGQTWYLTNDLGDAASAGTTHVLSDGTSQFEMADITAGSVVNAGDKLLIALNDRDFNNAAHAEVRLDMPYVDGLGNNTQVGPRWAFATNDLNNKSTEISVGYMDTETGDITFGSIDINVGTLVSDSATNEEITAVETNNSITFDVMGASGPAYSTTKLWQIDRFYDADGNFILGDSGKYLTIYNASGDAAEIFLDPDDTIADVAEKIELAVTKSKINGGLGMGTGDNSIDSHVCDFVTEATAQSDEAVRGTMVIRSPWMGERGKLIFSADENLLKALSLVTINSPAKDPMTITVRDAHTGELIGSDTVADSTLHGVIAGVDVELNPNLDVDVNWDAAKRKFVFTNAGGTVKEYLHIVDNAKSFQIGAAEGQTMDSYISEMTAKALGIDGVMVIDQGLASKAMTKLSNAIDLVSSERARIGAVVNRLQHTINNLEMQKESAVSSFSRIVDLDLAKETAELAKNTMLTQAAQAMLAQANQLPNNLLQLLRG